MIIHRAPLCQPNNGRGSQRTMKPRPGAVSRIDKGPAKDLKSALYLTTCNGREAEKRRIMTGRTHVALVLLALALLLLFPAALRAEPPGGQEVAWNDYRTPLTGVPVLYNEATIIWVYLPEEFLKGRSQVTLVWTVMSQVYSSLDRKQKPTFESCQPQLRVGQGMASGLYGLPVDPQSGLATQRLEIKTKHLKPIK